MMSNVVQEWLKDQPERVQRLARENPEALKKELLQEIINMRKRFPSHDFVPNVAQARATECFREKNPKTNNYPIYHVFTGANDAGKTAAMIMLIAGCALGNKYLHPDWYNYEYFDDCEKIRKKKPFSIRIICANADMEENGSVYQQMSKWIPTAKFSGRTSGGYYTVIKIPSPEKGYHTTVIDVRTHDMDKIKFSGSDVDLQCLNEPLEDEKKFDEVVGRIRMGGRIAMFLTPLEGVAYLQKLIQNPQNKDILCHTEGEIWENCCDIEGMRGHIKRSIIEAQIAKWKSDPATLEARTKGKFTHLSGAVFMLYKKEVHVCKPFKIPPNYNMVQVVDPHPSKSDVGVWLALSPLNVWYVVAEYPIEPWDEVPNNVKSIKMHGFDYKIIEEGKVEKFKYLRGMPEIADDHRIGDPNMMSTPQPNNNQTIQWQYQEDCQLYYNIDVNDNIALRYNKIRDLIYYDILRPISSTNTPRIFIFDTCINVQNAFINHCFKNEKPEKTWAHWIDDIGYAVVTFDCWEHQQRKSSYFHSEEYKAIIRSRTATVSQEDMSPNGVFGLGCGSQKYEGSFC